jgi:hypothetical protein
MIINEEDIPKCKYIDLDSNVINTYLDPKSSQEFKNKVEMELMYQLMKYGVSYIKIK